MKKVIKPVFNLGRSRKRQGEWLRIRETQEFLAKYFNEYYSHSSIFMNELRENTAFFYTNFNDDVDVLVFPYCRDCRRGRERITIEDVVVEDRTFWDWCEARKRVFCKEIYVEGYYAGEYCPRFNILFATDWTHSAAAWESGKEVIRRLYEMGYLRKTKEKLKEDKEEKIPMVSVTVGADIELELFEGKGERENILEASYLYSGTRIGSDGTGRQLEIRPSPSQDPSEVIDDIKGLLACVRHKARVVGKRFSLGSHIHISVQLDGRDIWLDYPPSDLIEMLDDFLGKHFRKITEKYYPIRVREGYGDLGDVRSTCHTGFEYRTPPSIWLIDPVYAEITLKIARNVVYTYMVAALRKSKIVYEVPPTEKDYIRIARLSKKEYEYWLGMTNKILNGELEKLFYEDIKKIWGIKTRIGIMFRDDWDGFVRRLFTGELNIETEANVVVLLYGLKKRRGDFIIAHDFDEEPPKPWRSYDFNEEYRSTHDLPPADKVILVGIDYDTRVGRNMEHVGKLIKWLKRNIEKEVKKLEAS